MRKRLGDLINKALRPRLKHMGTEIALAGERRRRPPPALTFS
jgi:hypothetical protein